MSATIRYRVVKPPEGIIRTPTPSSFIEAMDRAFGSRHPWLLNSGHIPLLRGMSAMNGLFMPDPFQSLIDKIESEDGSVRELEVWPDY